MTRPATGGASAIGAIEVTGRPASRANSSAVPRGLLRVDLFEDEDGPVLGEVTPEPGGLVIVRSDVDRMLGQQWEDAEARLRVRFARAGQLSPGLAPQAEASLARVRARAAVEPYENGR